MTTITEEPTECDYCGELFDKKLLKRLDLVDIVGNIVETGYYCRSCKACLLEEGPGW